MLLTIITFLIVLSILVLVHETGHFVAAKKTGVKVEEFGFGYPPRLFAFKKGETDYSLNWIPFGGFVKLKGMGNREDQSEDSFNAKKPSRRAVILAAGVVMNIFLAFVLITFGYLIGLPAAISADDHSQNVRQRQIQVYEVLEDSPAFQAGIIPGDAIASIDGQAFEKIEAVQAYHADKAGQEIILNLKRGREILEKKVVLEVLDESGEGRLGVSLVETGLVSLPFHLAVWHGFKSTFYLLYQIILSFYNLIKNALLAQPLGVEISGPVGIAVMSGEVARMGFIYIVEFVALLSLTLALINFLPLPALDGGHILFLFIEKIKGRPVNQRVENTIHTLGFYLILLLFVYVSFRDVVRFNLAGQVVNFFKNIFS